MPSAPAEPAVPPAPEGTPAGHEDAIRLGREEATRIAEAMWGEERQPPVDFRDPDRIRPGARTGELTVYNQPPHEEIGSWTPLIPVPD